MVDIQIVTAGAVIRTQRGDVILIMNQYEYVESGRTIHSCAQMEMFQSDVNDKSLKTPVGKQCITTLDGYCIPLNIKSGLSYMDLRPYTDNEWSTLSHVILTAETLWDPSILDNNITDDDEWYDSASDVPHGSLNPLFENKGNYNMRHEVHSIRIIDTSLDKGVTRSCALFYTTNNCDILEVNDAKFLDALEAVDTTHPIDRTTTTYPLDVSQYIPNFA